MIIYIVLLVVAFMIIVMAIQNQDQQKVLGMIYTIVLIIVSGFRYNVGMDYPIYEYIFNHIAIGQEDISEPGYVLLCKMCTAINGSVQMMFLICAIFTISLIYKSYRLFSPNPIMSLFFFMCIGQLYFTTFNAVRQCVAIAIFAYSIKYINDKKAIKYMLLVLLATTFHYTAIIFLPLYYLLRLKFSKIVKITLLALLFGASGIIISIIQNSPYAVYLTFEKFSNEVSVIDYMYLMLGLLIIVFERKIMRQYNDRTIFFNINLLCTSLFLLNIVFSGTPIIMVTVRLNYYFIAFYAIIIVRLINDIRQPSNKIIFELSYYLILTALFIRTAIFKGEDYNLLPYNINMNIFNL